MAGNFKTVAAKSCRSAAVEPVEGVSDDGSEVRRRRCARSWMWLVTIVANLLLSFGHVSTRGTFTLILIIKIGLG
ncbi:predicted protein [Arabidopsis lyrata subsp. lyrata]|uniref:Predicted protein n=1 Tax=Arabidopsis lyrata subsp. lyrata TaxID=81972 RepID=D7MHF3_ARALL|nr:predicted protein [Arabidopsis lyrata subsp. lyrata]